jgi:hypothetical protein
MIYFFISYKKDANSDKINNALIEIDLPSGYKYDPLGMKNVSKIIDHIEGIDDNTHVNVYLLQVNTHKNILIEYLFKNCLIF